MSLTVLVFRATSYCPWLEPLPGNTAPYRESLPQCGNSTTLTSNRAMYCTAFLLYPVESMVAHFTEFCLHLIATLQVASFSVLLTRQIIDLQS